MPGGGGWDEDIFISVGTLALLHSFTLGNLYLEASVTDFFPR